MPTASAWKEMATIACPAARKYQHKQELRAARQEASTRTPRKNAAARSDSVPAAEPTRESILRGLSLKLQNAATWPEEFAAVSQVLHAKLTAEEAQSSGIGKLLHKLKTNGSANARSLADRLLAGWVAEIRLAQRKHPLQT